MSSEFFDDDDRDFEPMEPHEAMELWLERLQSTRADETIQSYGYRIELFVDWCESEGFQNLNDLTARDIFRYGSTRRSEDLSVKTLNNQLGTLELFIQFCARMNAVDPSLPSQIEVPTVTVSDRVNEDLLSAERAEEILQSLERYEWASRRHAMFAPMWHVGCRLGGLHELDPVDCYVTEDVLGRLRHQDHLESEALEAVELPFVTFRGRKRTLPRNSRCTRSQRGTHCAVVRSGRSSVLDRHENGLTTRVHGPERYHDQGTSRRQSTPCSNGEHQLVEEGSP